MESFRSRKRLAVRTALLIALLAMTPSSSRADWNPSAWTQEETVTLSTNCPGEGEYKFPVWVVVIDGQAYIRLGTRAAARIECNATKPILPIEIAGQKFEKVRGVDAPEMVEAVDKAMGEKYTSDWFIRWFAHPLTLRLVPEPQS